MRKKATLLLVISLLLVFVLGTLVFAEGNVLQRPWYVIGGGGGKSQSAGYQANQTIGQPFTGTASSGSRQLSPGYWPAIIGVAPESPEQDLFLPAIFGRESVIANR